MDKVKNIPPIAEQGLSPEQVAQSRAAHGENVLTPPRHKSLWRLYLEKYEDPIIRILLMAAAVSLALAFVQGEFAETIGIILAVLFATTVGFYFEHDAARKFDMLTALGEEQPVKVVRSGSVQQLPRREIVVGDVVIVETGDEVPADGRLLMSTDLEVDESSLTGEPLAAKATVADRCADDAASAASPHQGDDKANEAAYPADVLLRSSMVMSGSGRYEVTAVGDHTEIGRVARNATELTDIKTPLSLQLGRLATLISKVGSAVSILAFLAFLVHDLLTNPLWWHSTDYIAMAEIVLRYFMMAVTLIVMAVPEGLPMAVTLALALNMRRMLKSNILVRKLQASETMGAVTVICTDKTGTLTQNRMTVSHLSICDGTSQQQVFAGIALNSTAHTDKSRRSGIGNPTEVALLQWMEEQGSDAEALRNSYAVVDRVPFSSDRKFMATLVKDHSQTLLLVKGAPEVVLPLCSVLPENRPAVEAWLRGRQQEGMRTLVMGMTPVDKATERVPDDIPPLCLNALVAISDPVRPDVAKAVANCREAGIEVKMVTGDTSLTAITIGRETGILKEGEAVEDGVNVISGADFAACDDDKARRLSATLKVMFRARPADKQRLVQLLQQQGQVVAVTGDGTNDAPALHHAHVGLSLGSGTSVAKEASDITLIDDSFRSVVRGVEWGRSLYRNIQRFLFFQLVVNVTALLLVLAGSVIGTEMPLTVTQILWVNLIMDTFAAMALASLPPSHEVMADQPRRQTDFILLRSMVWGIVFWGLLFFAVTFTYLYILEHNGLDPAELTRFFTVFVMLQWWNLFNARALLSRHSAFHHFFWCRGFLFVLVLILVGQWMIVEWGGTMFRTVPISWDDWLRIFVYTSPVIIIGELYRWISRIVRK